LLLKRLAGCIDRGLAVSRDALEHVGLYAQDLQAVDGILRPSDAASGEEREARFISLQQAWQSSTDLVEQHFAKMMRSFAPGLFVGGEAADFPADNLDLERCSRVQKATNAVSMAIATPACGSCGKVQR
jgi:hypothetical protein